jgi:hypothetical protein
MNTHELVERLKAQELAASEAEAEAAESAWQEVDPEDVPLEERVEIVRSLELSFDGQLDSVQSLPLAVGVDASLWTSAVLVLLVHRAKNLAVEAGLKVSVESVELDPDQPSQVFVGNEVALASYGAREPVPHLQVSPFIAPWGHQLRVLLQLLQRNPESAEAQTVTISVYLIGRLGVQNPLARA